MVRLSRLPLIGAPGRRVKHACQRRFYERGELEDTQGHVSLEDLGLAHPERTQYEPSEWSYLRRALRGRQIRPTDVFVDLGSGKGRVVYQAARRPFARVIGAEISEELNAVARRNIARARPVLAAREVQLVTADVMDYVVPDDVTFVYMYNAFHAGTFRAALGSVTRSLDRRPRPLTLIYVHPRWEQDVVATGRFVQVASRRGWRRDLAHHRVSIFEPAGGARQPVPTPP